MDFFARQAAARRQTRWLVLGFVLALLAVAAALDLVLFAFLAWMSVDGSVLTPLDFAARNPGSAVLCTVLVLGVLALASAWKSLQLRAGGGVVARSLGGVKVTRDTADPRLKRLHNVVEEMSIASGVPMPEVYVLEEETAINAFAAGHTPANAAVAVTRGALERLDRDQLQGVIAHEFSHILNGDMRLNVQLIGWLFGLFVFALIGRTVLRVMPRSRRGGAAGLVIAAAAIMALGYVGAFAGRILQAAVSRQRERLADASAVQFTRNPEGLKGALIMIAGAPRGSRLTSAGADQVAHMLFAQGLSRVFATHPPILERIRALDPRFDARELPRLAAEALRKPVSMDAHSSGTVPVSHAAAVEGGPCGIAEQVGHPQTVHIRQAHELRLALPEGLREFVESTDRARSLVLALLLDEAPAVRARQLQLIGGALGEAEKAAVEEAEPLARTLPALLRLPALQQIFPALRGLRLQERRLLAQLADRLARVDARLDVFEFCLARLLVTLLQDELQARAPHGRRSLADAEEPLHVLFATLARFGAGDEQRARMAYEAGMHLVLPRHRPAYAVYPDWPQRLGAALDVLERLHPFAKKVVIEGLERTVAHDGRLTVAEAELLRTVCATLHCPLPPLLPGEEPQQGRLPATAVPGR